MEGRWGNGQKKRLWLTIDVVVLGERLVRDTPAIRMSVHVLREEVIVWSGGEIVCKA